MKNIHTLPTDKPSRLHLGNSGLVLCVLNFNSNTINGQHMHITSDEEIKEGDWYYLPKTNYVYRCQEDPTELNLEREFGTAKVILTTDQDLIKNGVQAIDDEFLEWIIKNPSCEYVEVKRDVSVKENVIYDLMEDEFYREFPEELLNCVWVDTYKIIFPKQQTVEEYNQQGLEKYSHEFDETLEEGEKGGTNSKKNNSMG